MPLLRVQAEKLSNNMLERGVIEEIIDKDQLFALLPFMRVNGKAYVYNRELALSEGSFIDVNDTVTEGAATFTEVVSKLRILIGDVDVDKFEIETMSDVNDQKAIQIGLKAKALARKFRRTLAIGDATGNPLEFDGVAKLVTVGQTIETATNGAAVTLSNLDELKDLVKNGADVLMMRSGTWRAIRALQRSLGGTVPENIQLENFGVPVPAYDGIPVIVNDFLPADETQGSSNVCCSIYALRLNEMDGLHGIFGGDAAGIRVEDIGTVQNKDAERTRVKWYVGLALKATLSLARLKGVTNI